MCNKLLYLPRQNTCPPVACCSFALSSIELVIKNTMKHERTRLESTGLILYKTQNLLLFLSMSTTKLCSLKVCHTYPQNPSCDGIHCHWAETWYWQTENLTKSAFPHYLLSHPFSQQAEMLLPHDGPILFIAIITSQHFWDQNECFLMQPSENEPKVFLTAILYWQSEYENSDVRSTTKLLVAFCLASQNWLL